MKISSNITHYPFHAYCVSLPLSIVPSSAIAFPSAALAPVPVNLCRGTVESNSMRQWWMEVREAEAMEEVEESSSPPRGVAVPVVACGVWKESTRGWWIEGTKRPGLIFTSRSSCSPISLACVTGHPLLTLRLLHCVRFTNQIVFFLLVSNFVEHLITLIRGTDQWIITRTNSVFYKLFSNHFESLYIHQRLYLSGPIRFHSSRIKSFYDSF